MVWLRFGILVHHVTIGKENVDVTVLIEIVKFNAGKSEGGMVGPHDDLGGKFSSAFINELDDRFVLLIDQGNEIGQPIPVVIIDLDLHAAVDFCDFTKLEIAWSNLFEKTDRSGEAPSEHGQHKIDIAISVEVCRSAVGDAWCVLNENPLLEGSVTVV